MSSLSMVFVAYGVQTSIAVMFLVTSFITISNPPTPMPMSGSYSIVALAMIMGSMPVMTLAAYARQQARRIDALEFQLRTGSTPQQPE